MTISSPSASPPAQSAAVLDLATRVHDAVRSVMPQHEGSVALHEPEFKGREWEYVKECLDTGWVSSVGKFVDRFENMLAEKTGSGYAIATVNGTAALHVCLLLAGVRPGDEVLIPSLTFIATANAVSYAQAIPHLVDCEQHSLGVDVEKLERHLREIAVVRDETCVNRVTGAAIRALMPMHTFGLVGNLDGLVQLCERWRLVLIEDAAESLGSYYRGRHTGTYGRLAGLSFNGNKVVTTGGGGAILTGDAALARRAKHLTTTARVSHQWSFIHDEVGFNYRLPNINAALGCAQLEQLDGFLERKRDLHARYARALGGIAGVRVLDETAQCRSNYWLIALMLEKPDIAIRDAILQSLNDAGLMARPTWTLMHNLPMYAQCPRMDLSAAEAADRSVINVPSSPKLAG